MRFSKLAVAVGGCFVGVLFVSAVAAAIPVDSGLSTNRQLAVGTERVSAIVPSLIDVTRPGVIATTVHAITPAAEPGALMLFGTSLIGAARIARRRPAGQRA